MKILVQFIDPSVLDQVKLALDGDEFSLVCADSFRKAMSIVEENRDIDVIIVGAATGESDSVRLIRTVKTSQRLNFLPIMVVGESIGADDVRTFLDLDVNDIAVLPLQRESFRTRVTKLAVESRPTALVVDDDPVILDLLENFLSLERYHVLAAANAEDALALIDTNTVNVVISDIMMPGKSGFDLLVEVKEKHPQTPVILISGYAGRFTPQEIMSAGADGFFAVPFHNTELVYTLRRVLSPLYKSRQRNPSQPQPALPGKGVVR